MNLEKIKDLIETLECESKQKIFIKELKSSLVTDLLGNLQVENQKKHITNHVLRRFTQSFRNSIFIINSQFLKIFTYTIKINMKKP